MNKRKFALTVVVILSLLLIAGKLGEIGFVRLTALLVQGGLA